MVKIMNRLKQPLTLNVTSKKSLHLLARGSGEQCQAELTNDEFNAPEIKNAIEKGDITVLRVD